jgi:hypothetical protein
MRAIAARAALMRALASRTRSSSRRPARRAADDRGERQALDHDRHEDRGVDEEDDQVALGERRARVRDLRDGERRRERHRAAHAG